MNGVRGKEGRGRLGGDCEGWEGRWERKGDGLVGG